MARRSRAEDLDLGEVGDERELRALILSASLYAAGLVLEFALGSGTLHAVVLFVASYALSGFKVLEEAVEGIASKSVFNENFLLAVATLGAFAIREYPEAAGIMLLYRVGEYLQDRALTRSRKSIMELLELKADYANLKTDSGIARVEPEEVRVGDLVVVRPGEKIPLDGVVVEGTSIVDPSALTGESVPKRVEPGDGVLSGMVNLRGLLVVRVTKEYGESTVARILGLVEEASAKKARVEKFITRFARRYTPAVVALAIAVALVPSLTTGAPLEDWIYRALVLLVISCPCALVLSVPLGYFGGIGKCAREGILVKGSNFLDSLANLKIVALDKTGTLMRGEFSVSDVVPERGFEREEALYYAALAEVHSNHPIAQAIRRACSREIDESLVEEFEELAGYGVRARVGGI